MNIRFVSQTVCLWQLFLLKGNLLQKFQKQLKTGLFFTSAILLVHRLHFLFCAYF